MKKKAAVKKTKYREIVINTCYGGFGLSEAAIGRLRELGFGGRELDIARDDPRLVQVVRKLGSKADARFARLKIVKVPLDVEWWIDNYDGWEQVEERHRSWG